MSMALFKEIPRNQKKTRKMANEASKEQKSAEYGLTLEGIPGQGL